VNDQKPMITGEWRCHCGVLNEYRVEGRPAPPDATRASIGVSCGACGRGAFAICNGIPEGDAAKGWFMAEGRPISEGETE
jgi:hypothetical protein